MHQYRLLDLQGKKPIGIFNTDEVISIIKGFKACNNGLDSNCWFTVRCYFVNNEKDRNHPIYVINGENTKIVLPEPQTKGEKSIVWKVCLP